MQQASIVLVAFYSVYAVAAAMTVWCSCVSMKSLKIPSKKIAVGILALEAITAPMWLAGMVGIDNEGASACGATAVATLLVWLAVAARGEPWLGLYSVVPAFLFVLSTGVAISNSGSTPAAGLIALLLPHLAHRTFVDLAWAWHYHYN